MTDAGKSSSAGPGPIFQQYRIGRDHEDALVEPSLDKSISMMRASATSKSSESDSGTASSSSLLAREELIEMADSWTSAYRSTAWLAKRLSGSMVLSGHQPTLFHPGVWLKNFALDRLGRRSGGVAVNLVIDNDVAPRPSIEIPVFEAGQRRVRRVDYADVSSDSGAGLPFEQTTFLRGWPEKGGEWAGSLVRFPDRVRESIGDLSPDCSVGDLWRHVLTASQRHRVLGYAIAEGRHAYEASLGLETLEVPLSRVAQSYWFGRFVFDLTANLKRLRQSYNACTELYRVAHGIRSAAHPVPNLSVDDGWTEVPLWIYSDASPRRSAAWARPRGRVLQISDRRSTTVELAASDGDEFGHQWHELVHTGVKIRPRALVTTMYARCVLSDLFVHGIGGGKYDQLGELIAARVLGREPSPMTVISGTVLLRDEEPTDYCAKIRLLRERIRQTHYSAEALGASAEQAASSPREFGRLVEQKRELIRGIPSPGHRAAWHRRITSVNRQASDQLRGYRESLQGRIVELNRQWHSQSVERSRELSFCLYDGERLAESFERMLGT